MTKVVSIVEGDGEVLALPILLRRLMDWRSPGTYVDVLTPIRVYKDRFLNRAEEFTKYLQLAAAKCGDAGWILVLLDADDDCPAQRSAEVLARVQAIIPHRRVAVVLANREYEAWFIASAQSLNGCRGFQSQAQDISVDPELPRNAKGWLRARMPGSYGETSDQPAFSQVFDMVMAYDRSRSFRKLCSEWDKNNAPAPHHAVANLEG